MSKIVNFFRSTKGKICLLMIPAILIPLTFLLIPRKPTGMWGAIATIASSLVPLICGILAYFILKNSWKKTSTAVGTFVAGREERRKLDAVVFRQLVGCSRLGVLSTIYTDVVMLKKSKVGGLFKSYGIYKYVGKIEGGIPDLENCTFDVDTTTNSISVILPEATIVSHEILKLEKFDEKSSSFCRIENSEVMDEVQQRKTDAEQLLMEYGFMQEVEKRAQEVISGMITAMGYKGYDILFHGKGKRLQLTESTATDTIPQQPFPQSEDEQMETVE